MKKYNLLITLVFIVIALSCGKKTTDNSTTPSTLKEALKDKFLIGTALNGRQINEIDTMSVKVITENFNAIVAENCMKNAPIHPKKDTFNFELADKFVEFGEKYDMAITGHTLIWHAQLARWFCKDDEGNDVSADTLKQRMKDHIYTVVGRYKGSIKGWDVINEAINDDGSLRETQFYKIIGEEYLALAFQYAHEADPDAELYYNDYSMSNPAKRDAAVKIVENLKSKGLRIDAIGMQCHVGMDDPSLEEFEKSIVAFKEAGVKVMITELDVTAIPFPEGKVGADISKSFEYQQKMNPYADGMPDSAAVAWTNRTLDFFKLFLKYNDVIDRVTLWGVTDNDTWRNNWPIFGRTDYPLLFDRNYQPKPVVDSIINIVSKYN